VRYLYECRGCGEFESPISGDVIDCRCGAPSRRVWAVALHRTGARFEGHWNPQVGEYVANRREFDELLKRGADRQEREMKMECRLAQFDSRDVDGLAEAHGHSADDRLELAEQTQRARHDERAKANHESLVLP